MIELTEKEKQQLKLAERKVKMRKEASKRIKGMREKEINFQEVRRRINTKELATDIICFLKRRGFDNDVNNDITRLEFLIACNTRIKD